MRKIKKINGFLVVKFNDREKREYLSNDRGKSPARDDADTTAAMNKVTAMPY